MRCIKYKVEKGLGITTSWVIMSPNEIWYGVWTFWNCKNIIRLIWFWFIRIHSLLKLFWHLVTYCFFGVFCTFDETWFNLQRSQTSLINLEWCQKHRRIMLLWFFLAKFPKYFLKSFFFYKTHNSDLWMFWSALGSVVLLLLVIEV